MHNLVVNLGLTSPAQIAVTVTEKLSTAPYGVPVVHSPQLEGSSRGSCSHHLIVGLLQHALH